MKTEVSDYLRVAAICLVALLFFVWPIPHTISLRQIVIFLLLPIVGYLAYKNHRNASTAVSLRALKAPVILLAAITLWMLIVAFFISEEIAWSLDEIRGVWGFALLAFLLGVLTSFSFDTTGIFSRKNILIVLLLVLLAHMLIIDLGYLYKLLTRGEINWRMRMAGFTYSDKATYLSNTLFAFLCSDAFFRLKYKTRYLPVNAPVLAVFFLLTVFSLYIEAYRFGTISMLVILTVAVLLYVKETRLLSKKTALLGVIFFSFIFSAGFLTLKNDPRWGTLIETIPLALDTENNRSWLDSEKYPYPTLQNGEQVKSSNYDRVAWFKEGLLLVGDNPLGVGFGRDAFEVGLKKKYNEGRGHSHSGFIDMAIGTGVPGVLLWVSLLGSLICVAFKELRRGRNFAALLMILVVSKFSFRMMVDSIIRDHMLQQFFFVVGVLSVMMLLDEGRGEGSEKDG